MKLFVTFVFATLGEHVYNGITIGSRLSRDFVDVWKEDRLSYGVLSLGFELQLLNRTENVNKFMRFGSVYKQLFTNQRDKLAEFCNHYDAYLHNREVYLAIFAADLEYVSDCLENSSKAETKDLLKGLFVLAYNPNSNASLSVQKLTKLKMKFGVWMTSEDFMRHAPLRIKRYQTENMPVDALEVRLSIKDFFYDYNSFAEHLESEYSKLSQHIAGSQQRIIMSLFYSTNDAYRPAAYKCLQFKFCLRWGEQENHTIICPLSLCPHALDFEERLFSTHASSPLMFYLNNGENDAAYLNMFSNPSICTDFNSIVIKIESDAETSSKQMKDLAAMHSNILCDTKWSVKWDLDYSQPVAMKNLEHLLNVIAAYPNLVKKVHAVIKKTSWTDKGNINKIKLNRTIENHKVILRNLNDSLTLLSSNRDNKASSHIELDREAEIVFEKTLNMSTGFYFEMDNTYPIDSTILNNIFYRISPLGKTPVLINATRSWYSVIKDEFGGCQAYKKHYDSIRNWATIYFYNVAIDSSSPSKSLNYSNWVFYNSWFKNTALFGSGYNLSEATKEELRFLSNLQDKCVAMPKQVPKTPVQFNTSYSGVTFNLASDTHSKLAPEELAGLLKLIHEKFSATEIVVKHLSSASAIIQAIKIVNFEKRTSNATYRYFFNLGSLKPRTFASYDKFHGVHFKFCRCDNDKAILRKLRSASVPNVGISVSLDMGIGINVTDDIASRELIQQINYTVINIDLAEALFMGPYCKAEGNDLNKTVYKHYNQPITYDMQPNPVFDKIRATRFNLRRINPSITTYIQLAWPTINHTKSVEGTQKLWDFLRDFSVEFDFPYFIYEAFDNSSDDNTGLKYGWWRLLDDANSGDPRNYIDRQAEFYKLETVRPKITISASSSIPIIEIVIGVAAFFLLLLFAAAFANYRLRQTVQSMLTKEELQQFKMGKLGSSVDNEHDNDYCTIAYNKDKYEISKCAFNFDSNSLIGSGYFGNVYKSAIPKYEKPVAVKVPKISGKVELLSVLREIKLMSFVGEHENILKLVGAYTKEIQKGIVYVITEFVDHGSLQDYLRKMNNTGDAVLLELYQFCFEISKGMHFLSEKKVVHGDLSTRNVLLDENNVCKICDFGLSRKLYYTELYVKTSVEPVPFKWMAVEALERSELSLKTDIWSLGVTFWEIFSFGEEPYQGLSWDSEFSKKLRSGLRLPKPTIADLPVYEKILTCWTINPEERPNAEHFISFFQSLRSLSYTQI